MPTLRGAQRPDPGRQLRTAADAKPSVVAPRPVVAAAPSTEPAPFGPTPGQGDTDVVLPTQVPGTGLDLLDDTGLTPANTPLPADASFEDLNSSALDSALAAIEAQFGLTREQLLADQSAVGQEYQLLFAQAQQARGRGLEQAEQSGVERGIAQSGIAAETIADTASAFDEQLAQLELNRSTTQESISSQLASLDLQESLQRQEAQRIAAMRALDDEVLQALADAGL